MPDPIQLDYGRRKLELSLDDDRFDVTLLQPGDSAELKDPAAQLTGALANPLGCASLGEIARDKGPAAKAAIVISDHTRPVPDGLLIPALTEALGLADENITIIVGTGTHRGSTDDELTAKLGEDIVRRFRIVNHDCQDGDNLIHVGTSVCGGRCLLNRSYVEADLRIATGFIEPHMFAGFSGGPKAIVPGIAALETIQHFHRSKLIADPAATYGRLDDNPVQSLTRQMVSLCAPDFIVNVTLNATKQITGIFAGDMTAAHQAGCEKAAKDSIVTVDGNFPVVVTTNSGYPLDQNFYQAVKGIVTATRIVEPGGTVIIASECSDGLGDAGKFAEMLARPESDGELLAEILASSDTPHDQWQVQTLLQCLAKANVILCSDLSPADRRRTRTGITDDIAATLDELHRTRGGGKLPVAILPAGPLVIPKI